VVIWSAVILAVRPFAEMEHGDCLRALFSETNVNSR